MTTILPDLLEDMLAVSASSHVDPAEANDDVNLMEMFGVPPAGKPALEVSEPERAPYEPSIHIVVQSREVSLVAS